MVAPSVSWSVDNQDTVDGISDVARNVLEMTAIGDGYLQEAWNPVRFQTWSERPTVEEVEAFIGGHGESQWAYDVDDDRSEFTPRGIIDPRITGIDFNEFGAIARHRREVRWEDRNLLRGYVSGWAFLPPHSELNDWYYPDPTHILLNDGLGLVGVSNTEPTGMSDGEWQANPVTLTPWRKQTGISDSLWVPDSSMQPSGFYQGHDTDGGALLSMGSIGFAADNNAKIFIKEGSPCTFYKTIAAEGTAGYHAGYGLPPFVEGWGIWIFLKLNADPAPDTPEIVLYRRDWLWDGTQETDVEVDRQSMTLADTDVGIQQTFYRFKFHGNLDGGTIGNDVQRYLYYTALESDDTAGSDFSENSVWHKVPCYISPFSVSMTHLGGPSGLIPGWLWKYPGQ